MDTTSTGSPVDSGRTPLRLKSSVLACIDDNVLSVTAVIGLLALGFSTAGRAETVPAVMETSIPQLRISYPPYTVFNSLAEIHAAYPSGETIMWPSDYGGYDKAFWVDVHPLPGCGNCPTEPFGYPWVGQSVQISPYCLYGNGNTVLPVGYTLGGSAGDPICPSRPTCPPPPPPSTTPYTLIGDGTCWRPDPCPVPVLTDMTDPVALGFESGNRWRPDLLTLDYQTKLSCVQDGITAAGGTYANGSAYRPTQYQRHLFEIIDRDGRLNPRYMSTHPECQALRATISSEMSGHQLSSGQLVATPGTSRHESGTAFDVTPISLSSAQLNVINTNCGVTHTAVPGEPWHHQ
jgi:D-alanyl-D-alanine carboxypeptidase